MSPPGAPRPDARARSWRICCAWRCIGATNRFVDSLTGSCGLVAARFQAPGCLQTDGRAFAGPAAAHPPACRERGARATGEAEASALQAKGLAEAEALHARAEALAENQEAVIGQQIAEQMPEIVHAAAGAFRGVDNLTVLNGAQGMSEILNQIIAQAGSSMQLANQLLANTKTAAKGVTDGSTKLADGAPRRAVVKP